MSIAAFFDVDGTVLAKNSGPLYLKFLLEEGRIGKVDLLRGMWWFALYKLNRLDWERVSEKWASSTAGESEADTIEECRRWYAEKVKRHVRPEMIERMEEHRKDGHHVALLTAATIYLARPLGEDIGVDGYICNRLEVEDGKFTGKLVRPACYGDGKVLHAEKYAEEKGIDISKSFFYTDSASDIPVLERVGNPIIVNPDPVLRLEARRKGWPINDYQPPVAK